MSRDRNYWEAFAVKYAKPCLSLLADDKHIPWTGNFNGGQLCQNLEAYSRILYSLGCWLFAPESMSSVEIDRRDLADLSVKAFNNLFSGKNNISCKPCSQNIVDYGYLTWSILDTMSYGYKSLLEYSTTIAVENFVVYNQYLKKIRPLTNNWLLLAAMPEVLSYKLASSAFDPMRLDFAVLNTLASYKGGSIYGDGPDLHTDYYNSIVTHPALDTIKEVTADDPRMQALLVNQPFRSERYSRILERLISPEGTYPVIGRSATYRLGAFHHLSRWCSKVQDINESGFLGKSRCGMTAVLKRLEQNMFETNGMLRNGFNSKYETFCLSEPYVSTSSLYATGFFLLPLAVSDDHPFWSSEDQKWTQAKVWSGESVSIDSSYGEGIIL